MINYYKITDVIKTIKLFLLKNKAEIKLILDQNKLILGMLEIFFITNKQIKIFNI